MVFSLFDIRIKIDFSFILIIAFALLIKADNIIYLLIFSSLHEAGHIAALYFFNSKPDIINISFYGLAMKYSAPLNKTREFFVILAGPAVNLILSALCIKQDVNLPLFLVNIMPVYPLDGGRLISLLLSSKAVKIISAVSVFVIIAVSLMTKNISLILISMYLTVFLISRVNLYD